MSCGGRAGSGVVVYAHAGLACVLTAGHIYPREGMTVVALQDGRSYRDDGVLLLGTRLETDLAAVRFRYAGDAPLDVPVRSSDPRLGEKVWQIGFPGELGGRLDVRDGRVVEPSHLGMLRCSARIRSGNSGGPLFDDAGYLVGITNWSLDPREDPRQYCEAMPTRVVRRFVHERCFPWLGGRRPARPGQPGGFAPEPTPPGRSPAEAPRPPQAPAEAPPHTPPVAPATPDGSAVLREILARLDRIEAQKAQPGPAGKDGERGPAGPAGPKGDKGDPGAAADESRLAALEKELASLRRRFRVELIGPDGKVLKTDEFGADRPLRIQLVPLGK